MSAYASGPGWELHLGEALEILPGLSGVGALVTDPPYSSGGLHAGSRKADPLKKYVTSGSTAQMNLPTFTGDSRDQRSFFAWSALWLGMARRACVERAPCVAFADWRQLPVMSDAVQAGGWTWRGVVPWVKPGARPQKGRFSAASEFALWGSNGAMRTDGPCLPGWWSSPPVPTAGREHPTQKPLSVMRAAVQVADPGALVLDPFAGSGTTGVAALLEGLRFVGIEASEEIAESAARRLLAGA